MVYILFALREERYGYLIMQYVEELTHGRIVLGAGTMYSTLGKLEKAGLIEPTIERDRQKYYHITERGVTTLQDEVRRLQQNYHNLKEAL